MGKPIKFHPLKILVPAENVKFYWILTVRLPRAGGVKTIFLWYIATPTLHHHETHQIPSVEDISTTKKRQILRRFSLYDSRGQGASEQSSCGTSQRRLYTIMKPIKFHPLKILVPPKNVKFYVDSHCTTPEARGRQNNLPVVHRNADFTPS